MKILAHLKIIKHLILMFILFVFSSNVFAQFSLSGKILDSDSNPIEGANIVLKEIKLGKASNSDGTFVFKELKAGKYTLKISFIGKLDYSKSIILSADLYETIKLEEDAMLADEVVVTATRAGSNTPIAYTNLTKKEINERNLGQDIPVLLELIPAYVSTTDGGGGVGYTNMRIRGSDNSRINVTMNGIPMNDAESHGVWWVNMPDLASSLEDVQVQRGVGTSTNGAGAFGASINLRTNSMIRDPYAELNTSFGSFLDKNSLENKGIIHTEKYNIKAGSGLIADKFTFDARLSKIQTDGYIDRARADLYSAFLAASYYGDNNSIVFNYIDGKENTYQAWNGVPKSYLNDPELRTYNHYTYENEIDNYRQTHYQLHYNQNISEKWDASVSGFYVRGKGYYEQYKSSQNMFLYGLELSGEDGVIIEESDLVRQKWLDNDFYGIVYNVERRGESSDIVFGGGYNIYKGRHFGEVLWVEDALPDFLDPHAEYYRNSATKKDFNIYAKAEQKIGDKLSVYGDFQYRNIDYNFTGVTLDPFDNPIDVPANVRYDFFLPKAGISYLFEDSSTLFASYARGAKEPNRSDFTDNLINSVPNAEYLNDFEFGYRKMSKKFAFELIAYYMKYEDQLISTGKLSDVGSPIRVNVPDSYRAGIEITGGVEIFSNLRWDANFSYSNSIIKEFSEFIDDWDTGEQHEEVYKNSRIAFSPDIVAASNIKFTPVEGLSLGLISKYVGEQYIDNTQNDLRKLEGYFVNNLKVDYSFNPKYFKEVVISALVNNIFNVKYESNAWVYKYKSGDGSYDGSYGDIYSTESDRAGYYDMAGYFPQAGINILLGLTIKM